MPLIESQPDALAQTYATSLFELIEAQGGQERVESVLGELEAVMELTRTDARFNEFLASRVVKRDDRQRSLSAMFQGKLDDLTLRFLLVLNEKGRLRHLPPIVAAYDEITQRRFGRVEVDVYTASPLSGDELRDIREQLNRALGNEAVVHPYTDSSMIGGVKLQIGDTLIDASLATKLRQFKDQLGSQGSSKIRASAERAIEDAD